MYCRMYESRPRDSAGAVQTNQYDGSRNMSLTFRRVNEVFANIWIQFWVGLPGRNPTWVVAGTKHVRKRTPVDYAQTIRRCPPRLPYLPGVRPQHQMPNDTADMPNREQQKPSAAATATQTTPERAPTAATQIAHTQPTTKT